MRLDHVAVRPQRLAAAAMEPGGGLGDQPAIHLKATGGGSFQGDGVAVGGFGIPAVPARQFGLDQAHAMGVIVRR